MLRKLTVGPYQANCYILGETSNREGAVIDPGDEASFIVKELSKLKLKIRYILITHGHMDHTGAATEMRRMTQASVGIHPLDAQNLGCQPDIPLADGQNIPLGGFTLTVLHTPGHSPGGVCFHAPGVVFTGDTLFAGSIGRTDFPGGDHALLLQGVREKIFPLGDDLRIYPGHGPPSTIGKERRTNPFFR